jgi:hypothetical protein
MTITAGIIPFTVEVPIERYVAALEQHVSGNPVILRLWADIHERMGATLDMMGEGCSLLADHNWFASVALIARAFVIETILERGYYRARQLPNGEWLALTRQMFTTGLCVVKEPHPGDTVSNGMRTRFCFEHAHDAEAALVAWDGRGDPPGNWIKQKPEDRFNPRWLAEARAEVIEHRR